MAYQPMFSTGGGFNPMSLYESDEERRRREEQEARLRGELPAGPVAPPGAMSSGPTQDEILRDQEQRRQYDMMMAQPASVAGPMAPAMGPTPDEILRDQEQRRQYDMMMSQAVTPVAPGTPAQPLMQMAAAPGTTRTDAMPSTTGATTTEPFGTGLGRPSITAPVGTPETGMNYNNILVAASRDPNALMRVSQEAGGQWGKVFAGEAKEKLENQSLQQRAQVDAANIANNPDRARRLMERETEPNTLQYWLKLALLSTMGLNQAAEKEYLRGQSSYYNVTDKDGVAHTIKVRGDGMPEAGWAPTGENISRAKLMELAPQAVTGKKPYQQGEFLVDEQNRPFREIFNPNDPLNPTVVPIGHKEQPIGQLVRSTQSAGLAGQQSAARAGGGVIGTSVAEQTGAIPTGPLPAVNYSLVGDQPTVTPTGQPQAPAQPAPAAAGGPTQPAPAAVGGPAQPGGAGLRVTSPSGQTIMKPGAYQETKEVRKRAATEGIETTEISKRENIKINSKDSAQAATESRNALAENSTLERVAKFTDTHPHFFGAWIGSEAYRAFQAAQTDSEKRDALDRLAQVANIPKEDRPLFQSLVNDIRRLELQGITASGLTASQLNSDKESARAVKSRAPSVADSPTAVRIQVAIAQADNEYKKQWARYLAKADKRRDPSDLQTDFDETIGNSIYERLKGRIDDIRARDPGVVDIRGGR